MKRVYFAIFLISCSALIFEISLIRLFSIYLWYHFAFMVISIAMLGFGSAGTVLAIFSRGKYNQKKDIQIQSKKRLNIPNLIYSEPDIAIYSILAGISVIVCYIVSNHIPFDPVKLSWDKTQIFYLALYCLILSIPFFFSGIVIATAFLLFSEKSKSVYASDLLGAGLGCFIALALLNIASPEYAILSASILCLIGAVITGRKIIKLIALILILVNVLVFIVHPDFIHVKMSPYKRLSLYLKYPGAKHLNTYHSSYSQIDTFKSPAVRFAPGLSLKYLEPLPEQIGFAVDGSRVDVVTEAKDKSKLRFLEFLPSSIAYEIGKKNKVLVLDPKGGLHVLVAEHFGSGEIYKVESNPLLVRLMKEKFNEFSGKIFERNTWTGYGRNWLHGSRIFDLIDLPLTGTSVSGIFGISEDYKYTVEAFNKYLGALKKDGIMSISLYLIPPPRTEFRILATIISALERDGIKGIFKRLAAIRSWDSMTILVKNSPFTGQEINQLKDFSRSRRFDLVYYPGIKEEETNRYIKMPSNEYFNGFKNLLDPETRQLFISGYLFDIKPVYDENPFFHYYLKLRNIKAIYEVMGQKWLYFIEEGYLLPVIFIIVLVLSIIIILLPVILMKPHKRFDQLERFKRLFPTFPLFTLFYFAMLGFGFMFVEVSIIQKSILLLENPSYAVGVVLTAILVSSGIGSMSSSKYSRLSSPYSLLALSFLIFLYGLTHAYFLNLLSVFSLNIRIAAISISLLPLGLFMGIPFPTGIKLLGQKYETLIPWAWAVNACMSVLAPMLTIMLAMVIGFQTVIWFGSIMYLLAFAALIKLIKITRSSLHIHKCQE